MPKSWPPKDPQDVWDYGLDWSPLIARAGSAEDDPIVDTQAAVVEGSVVIDSHAVAAVEDAPTGQATVTWLSGGTDGETCEINLHILTEAGREADMTMKVKIKER